MDEDTLSESYARLFGSGEGALILEDLCEHLRAPVFPASNIDGIALAIRAAQVDGHRLLAIYILNRIKQGEARLSRPLNQPEESDTIKP